MIRQNKLKEKLARGETVIGTFVKSIDPAMCEITCAAGFDFVIIDNEHTAMSKETMVNLLRITELYDVPAIMRVRDGDTPMILQALDAGAFGVQVPNLRTVADAEKCINSIYYAPKGARGFANTNRAGGYGGMDVHEYVKLASENLMFFGYCETKEAYDNLDDILKLDGLDVVFIGPSDLSQAFGVIGHVNHPIVLDAISTIIDKTVKAGKVVGTVAGNGAAAKELKERGVRLIVMSSDHGMLAGNAKGMLAEFRS